MRNRKPKPDKKQIPQFENNTETGVKKSKGFHLEFLNSFQRSVWSILDKNDIIFLVGSAGTGKSFLATSYAVCSLLQKQVAKIVITRPIVEAGERLGYLPGPQPLAASVLTASGWTTMGQIKLGDRVIGRDGMPTEVIGVYPKGKKDTYKVTTFDGTSTTCCSDHLWYTQTKEEKNKKQQGKVRLTSDIMSDLKNNIRHYIPRNEPVHYDKRNLSIPPYTLGVLLGDGHTEKTHVRFASADQDIVDRVNHEVESLGLYCQKAKKQYSKACSYTLSSKQGYWEGGKAVKITEVASGNVMLFPTNKKAGEFIKCKSKTLATRIFYGATVNGYKYEKYGNTYTNPILKSLKNYGLHEKKAWEKFVPDDYKYSSVEDRIDILRGLLDTDGYCRQRQSDQVSFYTTSLRLANDVAEIVKSLGGQAKIKSRDRTKEENRKIIARRISYVVSIGLPKEINPFYLKRKAFRFVGKNLSTLEIVSIEKIGHEEVQCIKVDNPEHLYLTDDFIVTHNTFEEKVHPYMLPIYDAFDDLVGRDGPQRMIIDKCLEVAPIAYLRGRTMKNAVCILDEAQNCTHTQMKLFLTRIGMGSKMIITGDPFQSDLGGKIALVEIIEKLKDVKNIAVIKIGDENIVRHPIIGEITTRI
jgi:phosphate starvation-inducible PhoH-like protein